METCSICRHIHQGSEFLSSFPRTQEEMESDTKNNKADTLPSDVCVIQFCIHDRRNHPGLKPAGPFLLEALPTNSMQSKLPASKSS